MTKDSGLRIRIQKELRQKFLETCQNEDRSAAQVLREFMREYIEQSEAEPKKSRNKVKRNERG